jgi:hypothetical protein
VLRLRPRRLFQPDLLYTAQRALQQHARRSVEALGLLLQVGKNRVDCA